MAPIPPLPKKKKQQAQTGSVSTDQVYDYQGRTLTQILETETRVETGDVKELNQKVSSMQTTINSLTQRLESLEARVTALEQAESNTFEETWQALAQTVNSRMAGTLPTQGATYNYLRNMYDYAEQNSGALYDPAIFSPVLAQSGTLIQNTVRARRAQAGWLLAMCLVEICPKIQNDLYKTGYTIIGQSDSQAVYGYELTSDANIARMVASVIYAIHRPSAASLEASARSEIAGQDTGNALGTTRSTNIPTSSADTLAACADGTKFMPSTPKNDSTNPDYSFDEQTWNYVLANYTYSGSSYSNARAQQAVADNTYTDMTTQKQMLQAIGITMTTAQENLLTPCYMWGSRIVKPMNDGFDSVSQTTYPGASSNPRTDPEFRMRPFQLHNVHLLDPNDDGSSYLNKSSYPSGHTSFGWNIALIMIECYRNDLSKVKTIMTRYFQFGQSRTIGRYHWQADVFHGYVIGSACIARLHGFSQYISLLGQV